ncbi:hypothetical protein NA57DRAFT_51675 [Rhizodiscina lignyota]|uniref:Zn(2)-C6 fungal-type domain-containing protein n=1 Tax=Rhizodiscina lignyota TaxID=1504668 RepID=A0A9P4IV60_9PEZI|nr:hypothetical protein NA57DRAFT_51675 [Rhizodiscina lignyota]
MDPNNLYSNVPESFPFGNGNFDFQFGNVEPWPVGTTGGPLDGIEASSIDEVRIFQPNLYSDSFSFSFNSPVLQHLNTSAQHAFNITGILAPDKPQYAPSAPPTPVTSGSTLERCEPNADLLETVLLETKSPTPAFEQAPPRNLSKYKVNKCRKERNSQICLKKGSHMPIKGVKGATGGFVFGNPNRTRRRPDEAERLAIASTRRRGACRRCKKLKTKCVFQEDAPYMCEGCSKPSIVKLPCFLEHLIDAQLFRPRASTGHPLETLNRSVYSLEDLDSRTGGTYLVQLTQGVGEIILPIHVAEFVPRSGDKTEQVWKDRDGTTKKIMMRPYCIANLEHAKLSMLEYISRSRDRYIKHLKGGNEITFAVIEEARKFAALHEDSTVRKALDLVAASRIIERDWHIDQGTAIIDVVSDPASPWYEKRPITPMMDCQLDQLVIQGFLQPLREDLLKELKENIDTARREKFFEIFLTIFILLANAEQLLAHSRRNAVRHGAPGRYNSPERAMMYFHACKMMIAHFHYACNHAMASSFDWRSPNAHEIAKLGTEQATFMNKIQVNARNEGRRLLDLRAGHNFETPSYWTHQMFFENWSPGLEKEEMEYIKVMPPTCA